MSDVLQPQGDKVTAAHIRAGLRKFFPHPDCGIVFEVAQATGWNANRHLDAVAMDTWPSRGLIISGVEIKVSRPDFKREIADPAKAEEIARFCDKFYIAAPPGLIRAEELPHAWGLLEGGQFGLRVKKAATKTRAAPISREWLAAIFRAAGRSIGADDVAVALGQEREKLQAEFTERVEREAKARTTNNSRAADNWMALMKALGDDEPTSATWLHSGGAALIQVIKAVRAAGITEQYRGIAGLQHLVGEFYQALTKAGKAMGAPVPDEQVIALERFAPKKRGHR